MDQIIDEKTRRNEFFPHPDLPDNIEARLYCVFDTTAWEQRAAEPPGLGCQKAHGTLGPARACGPVSLPAELGAMPREPTRVG